LEGGTHVIPDLAGFLELNAIDTEIQKLREKQEHLPGEIGKIKAFFESEKSGLTQIQTTMDNLKAENKSLEQEIEDFKIQQQKSEEKLMHITTNAEYDAVHTEIETHKRKIGQAEDRIIQILSELEALEPQKKEAEEKLSGGEFQEKEDTLRDLEQQHASIGSGIEAREKQREAITKKISPKAYKVYQNLYRIRRNGKFVGLVTDARRYCGACSCMLTPQKFIEVKRNNTIRICESCGAILIWQKE
jgi:predicted  nucleic acid-binding Zn-ribbon protein